MFDSVFTLLIGTCNILFEILLDNNSKSFLSPDCESSEFTILKNFNFKLYEISIITIEHNFIDDQRNNIKSLLEKNNFVRVFEKISRMDDWYINKNNSV